ncbi:SusD/RagB family nutrient-binding outer membrane lipoprotein [Mangrovivirga sp. M17]|uniref:SusD/RagB family nutrient-binding outer membrane lipoprotein n=1 Tax=Mangrovivirga halotolerans TaxID=2993936 RepID=A0ABT3RUY3_9BACT|nr:SusD/RagB family nutrient-binding outer membrane lipoprotein [Mangrovivirga halotolerans]MCX2744955.1 SusD/RagB family nutrient-binding outer membrane lipoprotein [Mangrovivirga halotolerans]
MKLKIKQSILSVFAFALLAASACTSDFEEINTNPNGPLEVPSSLLISSVLTITGDQMYSTFLGGDMGSCWAQHWGKVQYNDEARYQYRETVTNGMWVTFYARSLADAKKMYELAQQEGNENVQGVALTLSAYVYALLTDVYGPIPMSEALAAPSGNNTPKYDSQPEVYDSLVNMLDLAVDKLGSGVGTINATSDLMYGGDASKWQRFANSLLFRTIMRMSATSEFSNYSSKLQEIYNSGTLFTSRDDEAKFAYLAAAPNNNPIYNTIVEGNRGEFKVNSKMIEVLEANGDPRLSVYAEVNEDGEYRGKPSGYTGLPTDEWNYTNVSSIGEFYLQATNPALFLTYSEQEFFISEAIARGFITGGSALAQEHYNNAVTADLESNGIGAADIASYLEANGYAGVDKIAEEKWVSLYTQGLEAFTEWRRLQVPALDLPVEAVEDEIPSRYRYPRDEQSQNRESYDEAVEMLGGSDNLTTKLWWNK